MKPFPRFTMGVGDRFGHQGRAQLAAFVQAREEGIEVFPVWNKSNREHITVKTEPRELREEADAAVAALGWELPYFVDADHITLETVDRFIDHSDFFTIDVADEIGKPAPDAAIDAFISSFSAYMGRLSIPGIAETFEVTEHLLRSIASKYLGAVRQASRIYQHIAASKGADSLIPEISMDETDSPQTPIELFFILGAIAGENIPIRTIAPKFTGRFNKGVDFVGDPAGFEKEFEDDVCVLAFAAEKFGLPKDIKLSVHSGSDKFSIYEPIRRVLKKHGAGLHLKTAGTTWLEELIGLAEAGGEGLAVAKDVYKTALGRYEELAAPYASVIDIDRSALPTAQAVEAWSSQDYVRALAHDQDCPDFNPSFRQLLHVAYKVAAELGQRFLGQLREHESVISARVTGNILERHIQRIFKLPS